MKVQFWSKTTTGKWAAGLTLALIVLMAIKMVALGAIIRLPLPTPVLALMGVVGLIAIFKNKDRALLALFSIPVGIIIIAWTIAEIAFPPGCIVIRKSYRVKTSLVRRLFLTLYNVLTGEGSNRFPSGWYGIMRTKNNVYKKTSSVNLQSAESE